MVRRVAVAVLVTATLVLAGLGAWTLAYPTPDVVQVDTPVFQSPDTTPAAEPDQFAKLAETNPVGMLAACLARYEQDAKGFRALLAKQERLRGKLQPAERVRVTVWGDVPGPDKATHICVRMIWDHGARTDLFGNPVRGTAYVEGENNDQILTFRPTALLKDHSIDLKGPMARDASRYCMKDTGIYRGMLRTYTAWKQRQEAGTLKAEFLGKRPVPEAGGRECYLIKRTCVTPEVDSFALDEQAPADEKTVARDGFTEVTLMIDCERRLQVGTVLKRADGGLLGEYYFRDLELVTTAFPPETFKAPALRD